MGHSLLLREMACEAPSSHENTKKHPEIIKNNDLKNEQRRVGRIVEASGIIRQLEKLRYQYTNQQLKIPISYREDEFIIAVQKMNQNKQQFVVFSITNSKTNKSVTKKQLFYETSKTISQ